MEDVKKLDIFVFSDESGVFDSAHNEYFVFGGIVFLSKDEKDVASRKYINAERTIRKIESKPNGEEIKAVNISNADKNKLYRSLNHFEKFGAVINQHRIIQKIFESKKTRQRYLDYAYKIAIKRKLEDLIKRKLIIPADVKHIYFFVDEHTTATDGRYELRQGLEQELKIGTFNYNFQKFFPPLFPDIESVELEFCNSKCRTLIRAADIIANKLYYVTNSSQPETILNEKIKITYLP